MLTTTFAGEERVTTAHRAKLAYVYIRQSTAGQVRQHQESTELQYHLAERAIRLGWPRDRVLVIDEDLGRSGASSDGRQGFQRLIAEIGLGKAGLVLSLDASRLARNNRDWHQLLELCSLFGVLLADGERLYDPMAYHDRLLLGLSGIMSEAELHQIRVRLHQGEQQKAARGELRLPLPAGLSQDHGGAIILNPDEEVQERLRLVFAKFRDLGSARAVVRYLRRAGLALPVRPLRGPAPHAVLWRPAESSRVLHIVKNPGYAGAYVYGRRRQDPTRRNPATGRCGTAAVPLADWPVCLHDVHPGYLSWEEFMANQKRLSDNLNRYEAGRHGAPRKGRALLRVSPSAVAAAGAWCWVTPDPVAIIRFTAASPTSISVAKGRNARRFAPSASMPRSSACCWTRWSPTRSPWPLPLWANWRWKPGFWSGSGRSGASGHATKRSVPVGNTTRSNRRIGWWRGRWSGPGRKRCGPWSGSSKSMIAGDGNSLWRSVKPTARASWLWGRTSTVSGTRPPRRLPTANASCGSSCRR